MPEALSNAKRFIATYLTATICLMSLILPAATRTVAQTSHVQADQSQTNAPVSVAAAPNSKASESRKNPLARGRRAAKLRQRKGTSPAVPRTSPAVIAQPVALVSPTSEPEYLFGQAHVTVKGNQDPIIRLGLAQHGPTVVEFPANDNFFAVHPGGSFLVTYDQSPTLANDHYVVFRAGKEFVAPHEGSRRPLEPLASISVQMQSGMFVTFLFYPVSHVSRMAHRCVVSYSREEVVAARRAVGLAVNLDGRDWQSAQPTVASQRIPSATKIDINRVPRSGIATSEQAVEGNLPDAGTANGSVQTSNVVTSSSGDVALPPRPPGAEVILAAGSGGERSEKRRSSSKRNKSVVREAQDALRRAVKSPGVFTSWSPLAHGLSIASLAPVEIDDARRLIVVAVRNGTTKGLRLLPGQPELDIQTIDESGRPVQIQPVEKLHVETSSLASVVPAGAIVYYAIVYQSPALGAQQRLRLTVAHMEASDEPASSDLTRLPSAEN